MNGRPKQEKKWGRHFWAIFIVSFIALCMLSEIVLAILNNVAARGEKVGYTYPLYFMPFIALAFTALLLYILGKNQRKSQIVIDSMLKIADGDYTVRIYEKGDKRFQDIYENFNRMAGELASVNTMREEFIHELSHEFKTPISSIQGFAELLLDGGLTDEEQKKFLRIIVDESARLWRLADNTLTMSRLENQQLIGEKSDIRLDEQIKDCIIMLEREREKKNLDISASLAPVTYRGNGPLLMQVWINILNNAVKFTPENGSIRVSLTSANDCVTVTVTDSGPGIAESEQGRIFEKYYRTPSSGAGGNGLGLAICKRICELSGGEISVSSVLGKGSTFTVKLPL